MRKVFLDNLPKKEGWGNLKGRQVVDWQNSVGYMVDFIYEDIEGQVEIVAYDKNKYILIIKYKNNYLEIRTNTFSKCHIGKLLKKRTKDFKVNIGDIFKDDERDLVIIDRKYKKDKNGICRKWYKYKCNKCGWNEGWIKESHLLTQIGCSCCCPTPRVVVEGINDIATTDRWMLDLGVSIEDAKRNTKSSSKSILVKCPYCKKEKRKVINNIYANKSIGCSCGDEFSYPEKFMMSILDQLNIKYINQLSKVYFEWCDSYRYDFYFELNGYNYIIETHGKQHYKGGFGKKSEEIQENDRLKLELAKENNIDSYIVINCSYSNLEFIKNNILNSELNGVFDLSNINWVEADMYAIKTNKVFEVCEYWNRKQGLETINNLAKIFNLSEYTIDKYLKTGIKLGFIIIN